MVALGAIQEKAVPTRSLPPPPPPPRPQLLLPVPPAFTILSHSGSLHRQMTVKLVALAALATSETSFPLPHTFSTTTKLVLTNLPHVVELEQDMMV